MVAQGAGVVGRICLAAWSDRSRSGRYGAVMTCMVAVVIGMAVLMTPLGRSPTIACCVLVWLGFFGFGWYGPWVAHVAESAPPGRTGFALGLAMSANQIAIVTVPPALGLLKDLTHSFVPAWALLTTMTAAALIVSAGAERRHRHSCSTRWTDFAWFKSRSTRDPEDGPGVRRVQLGELVGDQTHQDEIVVPSGHEHMIAEATLLNESEPHGEVPARPRCARRSVPGTCGTAARRTCSAATAVRPPPRTPCAGTRPLS